MTNKKTAKKYHKRVVIKLNSSKTAKLTARPAVAKSKATAEPLRRGIGYKAQVACRSKLKRFTFLQKYGSISGFRIQI